MLAVVLAVRQARRAIATQAKGLDFSPLRHAAIALLHGMSIYSDPAFVYPPTAAVAELPLSLGRYATTLDWWIVLSTVAVAAAGILAMTPWRGGAWLLLAALAAGLLVKSDAMTDDLWLGNVSLLLAPMAVAVLLLFEARRWRTGGALLVFSLLIKPLLLPFVLLPLLKGKWRSFLPAVIIGFVLLSAAIILVPGGHHFFGVIRYLLGGSSLTGRAAVYNISISGLAQRLHMEALGYMVRVIIGLATAAIAYIWVRQTMRPGDIAAAGALLLIATFLVGSLSEGHYLLVAAPCVLAALALQGRLSGLAIALPGLFLFSFPDYYLGNIAGSVDDGQVRFVLAELFLAGAAAALILRSPRPRPGGAPEGATCCNAFTKAR